MERYFYVTSQNQMSESESVLFPKGCLNLGVAHGLAGVGIALAYTMIKETLVVKLKKPCDISLMYMNNLKHLVCIHGRMD